MRLSYVLSAAVLLTTFGMAQTPCRQARASTVERQDGFAIYSLSLPLRDSAVTAQAVIPDGQHRLRAVVFSFSTLVASEPNRIVDMMPIAKDAARNGRAAIVLQRKLTWPTIAESVGNSQTAVMCAQQCT